ncbi:hypothetical protein BN1723_013422 [Verticillium longisporum]|uniref:Ubiquitin-like modifier-activating enzyme ATG7 n=1 Tax=Verticillium longisporum TaxID=100787 RepID=A0A0G4LS58_VERLO|nr:hypothetical protein BN1723_013422 [Verticillium longisporum]
MTLQFAPFSSDIELPFYAALFASKVDHDKLDDSVRKVIGQYTPLSVAAEQSCKMQIMGDALTRDENDNEVRAAREHIRAEGSIKNFNTLDEFKNADKQAMLQLTAKHIWHAINDGSIYEVPSLLSSFMILSYADLKKNDNEVRAAREHIRAEGSIKNFNTLDEFKNADKQAMLQLTAKHIWHAINDGSIYEVPSLLSSFMILSYADLKKYRFTYWFAFPALHSDPQWKKSGPVVRLTPKESVVLVDRVGTWTSQRTNSRQNGFFLAKKVRNVDLSNFSEDGNSELHDLNNEKGYLWEIGKLSDFETGFFNDIPPEDCYVSFVDSSTYAENPSWPLRNLLWLIRQRFRLSKVNILCYRELRSNRYAARSIIIPLETEATEPLDVSKVPKVTGWERDSEAKLRARVANLADYMDPARLADQSVDLNLKLMKWRISPNLDLDAVSRTKCLLLGAGTLGSYVSRNLLGWGVRKITFVDYGQASCGGLRAKGCAVPAGRAS